MPDNVSLRGSDLAIEFTKHERNKEALTKFAIDCVSAGAKRVKRFDPTFELNDDEKRLLKLATWRHQRKLTDDEIEWAERCSSRAADMAYHNLFNGPEIKVPHLDRVQAFYNLLNIVWHRRPYYAAYDCACEMLSDPEYRIGYEDMMEWWRARRDQLPEREFKTFDISQFGPNLVAILAENSDRRGNTDDPFRIVVTDAGLCINGCYGTNPSREEMRETLELMRLAIALWDKHYAAK